MSCIASGLPERRRRFAAPWRSGVPEDHPTVRTAEAKLIENQTDVGVWEQRAIPSDFLTIAILDYFRARQHRGELPNRYLISAKRLLDRAEELILTQDVA